MTLSLSRELDTGKAINIGRAGLRERVSTWLFGPIRDVTALARGREVRDETPRRGDEVSFCGAEYRYQATVDGARNAGASVVKGPSLQPSRPYRHPHIR